jgi:hypothetical protein
VLLDDDIKSPLQIGNGDFVFTSDATGFQTLHTEHDAWMPLCTMAQWGWHSVPNARGGYYTIDDVVMEPFDFEGRKIHFALNVQEGNEEPYNWMRKNPHRMNLARIALKLDGGVISRDQIGGIHQQLHLYEGYIESRFTIDGVPCRVLSACDPKLDALAFKVESELLRGGRLTVDFEFPYGDHHKAGGLWDVPERHRTETLVHGENVVLVRRTLDRDGYYLKISSANSVRADIAEQAHRLRLMSEGVNTLEFAALFSPDAPCDGAELCADGIFDAAYDWWTAFWEKGAAVRLSKSKHPKALELERRIIISLYHLAIQSAGSMPPAETGLTCNSWYGKFHLEMHFWHAAYLPLWNHPELLERSVKWYHDILPTARWNASRNGFKGARWPKMVAPDGVDCPSFIATLLIWQQPHILYMIELLYHAYGEDRAFARREWNLIRETAEFMADLPVYNPQTGHYDITQPVIPSNEMFKPLETRNPAFELAYWKFGLGVAIQFAWRLGEPVPEKWSAVYEKIAPPPMRDGQYITHELFKPFRADFVSCDAGIIGMLPGEGIDQDVMRKQYLAWKNSPGSDFMIGWTFAWYAMTGTRLGLADEALGILLKDHGCNDYMANGGNPQIMPPFDGHPAPEGPPTLPIYLPGNGGLLLAVAMMAAGYKDSKPHPGFPDDGQWVIETDGLRPLPF